MSDATSRLLRVLALAMVLCAGAPALACPNCKDSLSEGASRQSPRLGAGLSYSVMFMLAVPFMLAGGGAFALYRASRRGALPPL